MVRVGEHALPFGVKALLRRAFPNLTSDTEIWFDAKSGKLFVMDHYGKYLMQVPNAYLADALIDEGRTVIQFKYSRVDAVKRAPAAAKFLLLLIPKKNREGLLGDLEEEYHTIVLPEYGLWAARRWYWWQVCISIGPLIWAKVKRL